VKLLVTGAAGFIGSTYVRIAGAEHEVRVLD
jgi:nucleoside-diphosphate-sugar epimerase